MSRSTFANAGSKSLADAEIDFGLIGLLTSPQKTCYGRDCNINYGLNYGSSYTNNNLNIGYLNDYPNNSYHSTHSNYFQSSSFSQHGSGNSSMSNGSYSTSRMMGTGH